MFPNTAKNNDALEKCIINIYKRFLNVLKWFFNGAERFLFPLGNITTFKNALKMFLNAFQRFQMRCCEKQFNAIFLSPVFPNGVTNTQKTHFVLSPSIVSLISSELMWPLSTSCPPRSFTTPTRFSLAFNSWKKCWRIHVSYKWALSLWEAR